MPTPKFIAITGHLGQQIYISTTHIMAIDKPSPQHQDINVRSIVIVPGATIAAKETPLEVLKKMGIAASAKWQVG